MPLRHFPQKSVRFEQVMEEHAAYFRTHPQAAQPARMEPIPGLRRNEIQGRVYRRLKPYLHEFGLVSDKELARRTGVSRCTIQAIRRAMGIQRAPSPGPRPITPEMHQQICDWLRAGKSLKWVSGQCHRTPIRVREVASEIGWHRSWVDRSLFVPGPSPMIGKLTREQIALLYDQGQKLRQIGDQAGVSYERIRQVVLEAGREPKHVILRRRREERLAKEEIHRERRWRLAPILKRRQERKRRRELEEFLGPAKRLWATGVTLQAIAQVYKVPANSMAWYVHQGRTVLGWFPYRQEPRSNRTPGQRPAQSC